METSTVSSARSSNGSAGTGKDRVGVFPRLQEETGVPDIEALKQIAKELRVDIIQLLVEAGSGHPGGSLSEIDMLVALYFGGEMSHRPNEPEWADRDRFV